jgi:hypothetical protein
MSIKPPAAAVTSNLTGLAAGQFGASDAAWAAQSEIANNKGTTRWIMAHFLALAPPSRQPLNADMQMFRVVHI